MTGEKAFVDPGDDWRDTFLEFHNKRVAESRTCKECDSASVELASALVTCPRWNPEEKEWSLNGITYPLAFLICRACGHVNLYSATMAGVKLAEVKKADPEHE